MPVLAADSCTEPKLLHEPQHLLVIHPDAMILQDKKLKLPIAVFALITMVRGLDQRTMQILSSGFLTLQVGVESASGHTELLAEHVNRVVRP